MRKEDVIATIHRLAGQIDAWNIVLQELEKAEKESAEVPAPK